MPESKEHRAIKDKIVKSLESWYGVAIDEYYSSGHKLDAFSVTLSGISIYIEVIWYHGKQHFLNDMLMLEREKAHIKVVIANSTILKNAGLRDQYRKTVISQRREGRFIHGTMINGESYLIDDSNLFELKSIIDDLLDQHKEEYSEGSYFEKILNEIVIEDTEKHIGYSAPNEFIPQLEIIIGPNNESDNWFEIIDDNRWLVSMFCDINQIFSRRNYFDCSTNYGEYSKAYKNGVFYFVDNVDVDNKKIYYRTIFLRIIEKIIPVIRIMKYYSIDNIQSIIIRLYKLNHYDVCYLRSGFRPHSFPKDIDVYESKYQFNPYLPYDQIKEELKNIIKDIFKETNNLQTTDDHLERWLDYCLKASRVLGGYNFPNVRLAPIDILDFKLQYNRKLIIPRG